MSAPPTAIVVASSPIPWALVWEATSVLPRWGANVEAKFPTDPAPPGNSDCRHHPIVHSTSRLVHSIDRQSSLRAQFAKPPGLGVSVALPHPAAVNKVPDWGLRRHTMQMAAQNTTVMAVNKLITYETESCCLADVPKALTASVSNAMAKMDGSSPSFRAVFSNWR